MKYGLNLKRIAASEEWSLSFFIYLLSKFKICALENQFLICKV
jgi:hypothetical protein